MTDAPTTVDAVLWSAAVALTVFAVWLARPRRATWDIATFFATSWAARCRPGPLPLAEGPVPPEGPTALPEDPGPDYDPSVRIGPGCSWAAFAAGSPVVDETIARRLAHVHIVWFEPPTVDLGPVEQLPAPALAHGGLEALIRSPDTRLVLVASTQAQALLELLHEMQGLRDRVLLVLFVGATFDPEWVAREFRHERFDLELAREVPYCTLRTGPGQVLRSPPPLATDRTAIDVVDLGLVASELLAAPELGLALRATIAAVVFA